MNLSSNDLEQGEKIPEKFTCDGENVNPELHWDAFPEETKSFALTVRDPDAPSGDFAHWLLCNIPAETTGIAQDSVPKGSKQVGNDFGKEGYGGPCPPSGTHRYYFKIFAKVL